MEFGKVSGMNNESKIYEITTEIGKTYISLKEKLYEKLKDGDYVSFLVTKLYLGGKIVLVADYVRKENEIILKKQ